MRGWVTSSLRRDYVDAFFTTATAALGPAHRVVDVGGYRDQRRGQFPLSPSWYAVNLVADHAVDLRADARRLPFAPGALDAVLCSEMLEHVADPVAVLREIARVLRPGGSACLSVPFLHPIHGLVDYGRYTDRYWQETCLAVGFEAPTIQFQGGLWSVIVDSLRQAALLCVGDQRLVARLARQALHVAFFVWARPLALRLDARALARSTPVACAFTTGFGIVAIRRPAETLP